MPTTVSVVVPTRNSATVIGDCLTSLASQTRLPDEIVVCDGGSTDDTVAIAKRHGAYVVETQPNRSAQRNRGAEVSTGEFLLFVDSDMQLTTGVIADCLATFSDGDAALVIPEVFVGEGFWANVRGFERTFYDRVWWLEAARWYRREQFLAIGGFDAGLVGPEDWDLDQRIRQFGEVRWSHDHIVHNEGRTQARRLLQKKSHYAASFATFTARHPERARLCFSALQRTKLFFRQPARLLQHPILTVGAATLGLAEFAVAKGWTDRWSVTSPETPHTYSADC